jgi:hypothetical protein
MRGLVGIRYRLVAHVTLMRWADSTASGAAASTVFFRLLSGTDRCHADLRKGPSPRCLMRWVRRRAARTSATGRPIARAYSSMKRSGGSTYFPRSKSLTVSALRGSPLFVMNAAIFAPVSEPGACFLISVSGVFNMPRL